MFVLFLHLSHFGSHSIWLHLDWESSPLNKKLNPTDSEWAPAESQEPVQGEDGPRVGCSLIPAGSEHKVWVFLDSRPKHQNTSSDYPTVSHHSRWGTTNMPGTWRRSEILQGPELSKSQQWMLQSVLFLLCEFRFYSVLEHKGYSSTQGCMRESALCISVLWGLLVFSKKSNTDNSGHLTDLCQFFPSLL